MTRRTPALLTLLGLAATAGCQGGDTLRSILSKARAAPALPDHWATLSGPRPLRPRRKEHCLASTLQAGLAELQRRLTSHDDMPFARPPRTVAQLRQALGELVIVELATKTGFAEADLLARLARGLPLTVSVMAADAGAAQQPALPALLVDLPAVTETRC